MDVAVQHKQQVQQKLYLTLWPLDRHPQSMALKGTGACGAEQNLLFDCAAFSFIASSMLPWAGGDRRQ